MLLRQLVCALASGWKGFFSMRVKKGRVVLLKFVMEVGGANRHSTPNLTFYVFYILSVKKVVYIIKDYTLDTVQPHMNSKKGRVVL